MRVALALSLLVHAVLLVTLKGPSSSTPAPTRRLEWTEVAARMPPAVRPPPSPPRAVRSLASRSTRRAAPVAPAPVLPEGPGLLEVPSPPTVGPPGLPEGEGDGDDAGVMAETSFRPPPTPPRLLTEVRAEYPEALRDAEVQGDVELSVTVEADGHVSSVTVVRAVDEALAQVARRAVEQSRWQPGTRDGVPARASVRYVYSFVLE
jgi:TonB family protein